MSRCWRALLLAALLLLPVASFVRAQEASPGATPVVEAGPRLDLAAMALTVEDVPAGYVQASFNDEGYTPAHRISAIQLQYGIPQWQLDALEMGWFYSSTFQKVDASGNAMVHVYLQEYLNVGAVERGFEVFENEEAGPSLFFGCEDVGEPAAGDAPKEITACSGGQGPEPVADATFRVDRVLAGVVVVSPAGSEPDVALADEMALALEGRIRMVLAGETPPGVDLTLPSRVLPVFATWPHPGNAIEGYKHASEFLGEEGALAALAEDYVAGYAAIASPGSNDRDLRHIPPSVDIEIAEFASPEAALQMLEMAHERGTRYTGTLRMTPAGDVDIPGTDVALVLDLERPSTGMEGSYNLGGTDVVFVSGTTFVSVSVLVDTDGGGVSLEEAQALAVDLATQQAACAVEGPCGAIVVAPALATPAPRD